ncbi:MAG: DUF2336 domain-containing protein [Gammaproteobacteria bacterium]|nr:DUF2336 domain-containing protein [Gammaproteobacteria bacterium]
MAFPDVRADCARYFTSEYASGEMSQSLREAAAPILREFAVDALREVREAIAQQLESCPFLPVSVARTLALDVESVAVPFIRNSSVLTDEDLVALVRVGGEIKQIAVAERITVSEVVSGALVDTENRNVVSALLANANAAIAEQTLHDAIALVGDDAYVQELFARRAVLPPGIKERLFRP